MMEYLAMDFQELTDFNSYSKFMTQKGWVVETIQFFPPPPDQTSPRLTVLWSRVKGD